MAKAFWKLFCQFLLTQLCFFNPLAPTAQAKIALEDSHLVIDGVKTFLYGGDFQYFRIRDRQFDEGRTKELWAKTIIAMREAGLNLALVYVPWDYHEREEGQWDFSGARDVAYLMQLMQDNGLSVILKPGPNIMAEWPHGPGSYGAVPLWWKRKHPEALAITASGKPFKFFSPFYTGENQQQPTYLHPNFLSYVKKFYARVAQEVQPFIGKTVIGIQIDNETNKYWSDIFTEVDYSPSARLHYHLYLKHAYKNNIGLLNQSYGAHFTSFSQVEPPKKGPSFGGNRMANSHMWDWYKAQENSVLVYLKILKNMLEEVGFREGKVLHTVNEFLQSRSFKELRLNHTVLPFPEKNKVGLVTLDFYPKAFNTDHLFNYPFIADYYTKLHQSHLKGQGLEPYVFAAELQGGMWGHSLLGQTKITDQGSHQLFMKTIGNGLKGLSLYVFQDGINLDGSPYTYQAPLDVEGNKTQRYEVVKRWGHFLQEKAHFLTHTEPVSNRVALLANRLYSVPQNGFIDDFPRVNTHEAPALFGWLLNAGYQVDVVDSQDATLESLSHYTHVLYQNPDIVDVHTESLLTGLRERGVSVVTFLWPGKSLLSTEGSPLHPLFMKWAVPVKSFLSQFHHTASGLYPWWNVGRRGLVHVRFPTEKGVLDMPMTSYWYATTVSGRTLDPSWDTKPFMFLGNDVVGFWHRDHPRDHAYVGTNVYYPFNSNDYYALTQTQWVGLSSLAKHLLRGESPIFQDTQLRQVVWARKSQWPENPYAFIFLINDDKETRTLWVKPSNSQLLGLPRNGCVRLETQMQPGAPLWEGSVTQWEQDGAPWVVEPFGGRVILATPIPCPLAQTHSPM